MTISIMPILTTKNNRDVLQGTTAQFIAADASYRTGPLPALSPRWTLARPGSHSGFLVTNCEDCVQKFLTKKVLRPYSRTTQCPPCPQNQSSSEHPRRSELCHKQTSG